MPDITIKPVADARDRDAFIAVYRELYRGDPLARIPLDMDMKAAIDPARSSFLKENPHAAWIALVDGQPAGRIMAIRNKAHLARHGDGAGHFGYLEFSKDKGVLDGLLAAAQSWMREQGLSRMTGPFSPSVNHETGLLIDGYQSPPTYMMNYAPPHYGEALEQAGFAKAMDIFSYVASTDRTTHPAAVEQMLARIRARPELRLRTLDIKHYRRDIELLVDIYNDGWSANWGSVPITTGEAQELGTLLRPLISPHWVNFVEVDGQAIAVTLQMPDLNEAARDLNGKLLPLGWAKLLYRMRRPAVQNSRMLMLGVRQAWQGRSAGTMAALLLIDSSFQAASGAGIRTAELGWVLETNQAILSVIEKFATTGRKTYRIYEKAI
jgi:hypothetical protein